jgi:anti-sigma factor RsiW
MRCGRAQKHMTAAVDGELGPRQRGALDRHLAGCDPCRRELAATERTLRALDALPMERAVSDGLEQTTLRRVRLAAAEEEERAHRRWRLWLPIPAFAVATVAVLVLAVGILTRTGEAPAPRAVASAPLKPSAERLARAQPAPPTRRPRAEARQAVEPPAEPPAELAAAPDLFMNLPILKNMERLEHFEAIQTTTLDDEMPSGQAEPSSG